MQSTIRSILVLAIGVLLAACIAGMPEAASPEPADDPSSPAPPQINGADVLFVRAVQADDGRWAFTVTVQHPDTGWDNYADGWDVVTLDGTVLLPSPDAPFTRELLHPHVDEQPFTRSQSGIVIPDGVTTVRVRAHSNVGGYAGRAVTVDLTTASGPDYTVESSRIESAMVYTTHHRADGNRLVNGAGSLSAGSPLDIALEGLPTWIVAAPTAQGSLWIVALSTGAVQSFYVQGRDVTPGDVAPVQLAPDMPPALMQSGGLLRLVTAPSDASPFTNPTVLQSGVTAYVAANGDLVLWDDRELARFPVNALPDARILVDEQDRLLLLTGSTTRYAHGVLGDANEASSITLIETDGTPRIALEIPIEAPQVIEQLIPLWVDWDLDGRREIIVTVSDSSHGARVIVFDDNGHLQSTGPAVGIGNRWRHVLAVAPFGPQGELELAEVLTPHIGGGVQFFRMHGESLEFVAHIGGYTSHRIASRNMDMAVAGDFDGDGQTELLLPGTAFRSLGAIRRTAAGAEVAWTLPVDGMIATNLAAVELADGGIAVGVGRADGVLRLWLPER